MFFPLDACFFHADQPFTLISVRDYTASRSWTTTISFCLGVEGLCFIRVIPTASLLFRNWDAESETWKRAERSKVTQSLRSAVQHRSSALCRTYTALHIHQCVKVWQIRSSFPHSRFITDLPNSQLSAPLKDQGTDVREEEVFRYTLRSSFHQPLRCLLLRAAGPALDRAHSVTGPARSSRTESIWEGAVPLWRVLLGLQLKSDCTPTVLDQIITPYNS